MIRTSILGLALGFAISGISLADDKIALEAPQFAIKTPTSPDAPNVIVIFSCRADDLTGQPGRQDPASAAPGWKDIELHSENATLECKGEITPLFDQVEASAPARPAPGDQPDQKYAVPLNHNFGDPSQCIHAALSFTTKEQWDKEHPNWTIVAIGCPSPIVDSAGKIVGWHLPECPSSIGGFEGIECKFDANAI
jgi:hypothetical protein